MIQKLRIICMVVSFALLMSACDKASSSKVEYDLNNNELYTQGSITYTDDITINKPDTDEYYTFTLNSKKTSSSDSLLLFNELCDKYCKNKFNSSELDEKKRFISPDIERNDDNDYPYKFPKISDHLTEITENKIKVDEFFIDDKTVYLSVKNGNIHALDKGSAYSTLMNEGIIEKSEKPIGIFFPDWYCKVEKEYFSKSDDKIILSGEELTVSEAESKAVGYVNELYGNNELEPFISQARTLDMNGKTGLSLFITNQYKGVPFDAGEVENAGILKISDFSNGKNYEFMPGTAFMDNPDELDIIEAYNNRYDITNVKKADLKIGINDATRIVDEQFTEKVQLNISRIELVYCKQIVKDGSDGDIVYDCYPVWKMSAKPVNSNTDLYVYANALDGECYYYESR